MVGNSHPPKRIVSKKIIAIKIKIAFTSPAVFASVPRLVRNI